MRILILIPTLIVILIVSTGANAQKRKPIPGLKNRLASVQKSSDVGANAVVIDETLSVLRASPSLFAESIQRMRRGRQVKLLASSEADGVKFYKVAAPPANFGWVQADAVFRKSNGGDEERLARLVQASNGFDQIEVATEFFNLYPNSKFKPSILLLFGDLLEEVSVKLSKDANNKLNRREMAASGAPMHSYFLNFVSLDRYRKLGIIFLFNPASKQFHYEGASWKEIAKSFSSSPEAAEAQKRIDSLKVKMETTAVK